MEFHQIRLKIEIHLFNKMDVNKNNIIYLKYQILNQNYNSKIISIKILYNLKKIKLLTVRKIKFKGIIKI